MRKRSILVGMVMAATIAGLPTGTANAQTLALDCPSMPPQAPARVLAGEVVQLDEVRLTQQFPPSLNLVQCNYTGTVTRSDETTTPPTVINRNSVNLILSCSTQPRTPRCRPAGLLTQTLVNLRILNTLP